MIKIAKLSPGCNSRKEAISCLKSICNKVDNRFLKDLLKTHGINLTTEKVLNGQLGQCRITNYVDPETMN